VISRVLAHNLRFYRAETGLSQNELADKAGMSFRSYQALESGVSNPTLQSIDRLSVALSITAGRLLSLDFVRTPLTPEQYLRWFIKNFEDAPIGVGIRDLNGVSIFRNKAIHRLLNMTSQSYEEPFDLLSYLPATSAEIMRAQMASEASGLVTPYVNIWTDRETGIKTPLRFYPVQVLPLKGKRAYFTAMYVTEVPRDCQKNYYDFCNGLLYECAAQQAST